ncbi:MAG: hypothetical protein V5B40_04380 [Candidatus Accumulibacter meliphilus]|jgi:hypothetical protein|uniref:DUF6969 family protein n=1 Tax=Candidatus Accumulibacter meliphilus TaxID=2211374 RepID=UPI002FC33136
MKLSPSLDSLSPQRRASMLAAAREIRECYRVLEKGGINLVGEVLRGQGEFVELEHYPRDDVFDSQTHAQYYYHTHRDGELEHGHFHLFLRAGGMPPGCRPLDYPQASDAWPAGDEALGHLVAISMDGWGFPIGLFCTNRWVTAETWYPAEQMIAMLDRFAIDHAFPNWAVNRWLTAMLRLYRPQVELLIRQRDEVVAAWQDRQPGADVFEDRKLEITGYLPIDVEALTLALEAAAGE